MDLSKAFDTLNHDLLLAKLNAYGFSTDSLALIRSYLKNRWQRTKINTAFSSWTELLLRVPQGSVLGPLMFNIYINFRSMSKLTSATTQMIQPFTQVIKISMR